MSSLDHEAIERGLQRLLHAVKYGEPPDDHDPCAERWQQQRAVSPNAKDHLLRLQAALAHASADQLKPGLSKADVDRGVVSLRRDLRMLPAILPRAVRQDPVEAALFVQQMVCRNPELDLFTIRTALEGTTGEHHYVVYGDALDLLKEGYTVKGVAGVTGLSPDTVSYLGVTFGAQDVWRALMADRAAKARQDRHTFDWFLEQETVGRPTVLGVKRPRVSEVQAAWDLAEAKAAA